MCINWEKKVLFKKNYPQEVSFAQKLPEIPYISGNFFPNRSYFYISAKAFLDTWILSLAFLCYLATLFYLD